MSPTRSSAPLVSSTSGLRTYLRHSREPLTATILVLPLFVAYQVGILLTGGLRNGVDFITDGLMLALGGSLPGYLVFNAIILAAFGGAIVALRKKGQFHPRLIPWMLLESVVYALLFSQVVVVLIHLFQLDVLLAAGAQPQDKNLLQKLVMSIGAGLYEELVFRVIIMGGIVLALTRVLRMRLAVAGVIGLVVSSLIFSAVHHLGPLGEAFTLSAFTFRFFAGVVLAAIFQLRGFAIAAYTHALYDVYVMVFRGEG